MKADKPFRKSFVCAGILFAILTFITLYRADKTLGAYESGRVIGKLLFNSWLLPAIVIGLWGFYSKKRWSWLKTGGGVAGFYLVFMVIFFMGAILFQDNQFAKKLVKTFAESLLKGRKSDYPLAAARKEFTPQPPRPKGAPEPLAQPPPDLFRTVHYDSQAGKLAAYLTPDPKDGKKRPAIVWITGGNCNSIDRVWEDASEENEQTASAYRKAGIIMMFPSLRGGNDNPGVKEGFFGEVDDVQAAAAFLAKQDYVDPKRVYLGGHSTGGTLALLVAECSGQFRAVISFGPVFDIRGYGKSLFPFDTSSNEAIALQSPGYWLDSITSPVFVFEGTTEGNFDSLDFMRKKSKNPKVHFLPIKGATHFTALDPTNKLIAERILKDDGPDCNLNFTEQEVGKPFQK